MDSGAIFAGPDGGAALSGGAQSIERVHQEVDKDLLKLDAVDEHRWQSRVEVDLNRDVAADSVVSQETHHVLDDGVDVNTSAMRSILLDEPPHVPDDFTRPLVVRHDVGQDLAKVLGIFDAAVEHSPGRLGVAEDRGER